MFRWTFAIMSVLLCFGVCFAEIGGNGIIGNTVVTAIAGIFKGAVPPEIIFGVLGFLLTRVSQAILSLLETRKQGVAAKIFWFAMQKLFGKMVVLENDLSWIGQPDEKEARIKELKKRFPILSLAVPSGEPSSR